MPSPRVLATGLVIILQLLPAPAWAGSSRPPERESSVIVYGADPCPTPANENEAIVCARRPEEERFRIPRRIRDRQSTEVAWGSRVEQLEETGRPMRPNSCSVVGSFGQSGCMQALIRQWYADRRARAAENAGVP
jgi:hypothetical protein